MSAYYNEFDPFAAQWLRNLIIAGYIAPGEVDTRSITDVRSSDLKGFTQCHFFAGIGGWSYALRLAGWPDDRQVWTGSCPCQPFSAAGKQLAQEDARHLAPTWLGLIRECAPPVIFGEQVAAAITKGWLDDLSNDLETQGYAVASAVLPACSVGAPHKRDRLWFVADSGIRRRSEQDRRQVQQSRGAKAISPSDTSHVGITQGDGRFQGWAESELRGRRSTITKPSVSCSNVANADDAGSQGRVLLSERSSQHTFGESGLEWVACPDGKWRPVKPGVRLLANGITNRVGRLRAYGNAIVPQVAAEFIGAYLEC